MFKSLAGLLAWPFLNTFPSALTDSGWRFNLASDKCMQFVVFPLSFITSRLYSYGDSTGISPVSLLIPFLICSGHRNQTGANIMRERLVAGRVFNRIFNATTHIYMLALIWFVRFELNGAYFIGRRTTHKQYPPGYIANGKSFNSTSSLLNKIIFPFILTYSMKWMVIFCVWQISCYWMTAIRISSARGCNF